MSRMKVFLGAILVLMPMLVIIAESETGSALVYVGFIYVLYREGLSGWWLALMGLAVLLFVLTVRTQWWISLIVVVVCVAAYLVYYLRRTPTLRYRRRVVRNAVLGFVAGLALILASDVFFNNVLKGGAGGE